MLLRTTAPHPLFHLNLKPSIPKTLIFSRHCTTSATVSPPSPPSSPPHPWPEWVSFVDRLKSRGYFPNSSSGDEDGGGDGELVYRDPQLLKGPCLSFARDRFDVFKSLSKDDIQNVVEIGCPTLARKVVNSAKRLREYVGLEEKNVCDVCSLRGSCDRAYLKPNDSSLVQTADIMRLLLFYALEPMVISEAARTTNNEQAESSVRRLLSMLMDLSEASRSPVSEEIPYKKEKIVKSAGTVLSQVYSRKQEWVCPKCSFLNFSKSNECQECNVDRPKMQGSAYADVNKRDWSCSQCNYVNFARNINCLKCNKEAPTQRVILKTGDWHCHTCKYLNYARNTKCRNCEEDVPEKKESVHNELKKGDWNCPQCGSLNFSKRTACHQCSATRQLERGDWVCSMCNFINFRRNVKCRKCETQRVKEAASEGDHLWIKPMSQQMG